MTILTVIRDAEGKVINIGAWDYMAEPRPVIAQGGELMARTRKVDEDTGLVLVGPDGLPELVDVRAQPGETIGYDIANPIIHNPLPEGATIGEAEIGQLPDGGLYVVDWAHGDGHDAMRLGDGPQGLEAGTGPGFDISECGG